MTDDCRRFDEAIVDLCYEELGDQEAEKLREHASLCPRCRGELESFLLLRKLTRRLPEAEPPSSIDALILKAARARAAELAPQAEAFRSEVAAAQPLTTKLRHWFLRPSLVLSAMTAVIAVGAFVILKTDTRTSEEAPPQAQVALREPVTDQESDRQLPQTLDERVQTPPPRLSETTEEDMRPAARSRLGTSAGPPARPSAPAAENKPPARVEKQTNVVADGGLGARRAKEKAEAPYAPQAASGPLEFNDVLTRALASYKRGDCQSARPDFLSVASDMSSSDSAVATALHHLARCEKRSGTCGKAITSYARLLRDHPRYNSRPEALLEAAQCHRKLGHTDEAQRLLEELSAIPGYQHKAQIEMNANQRH